MPDLVIRNGSVVTPAGTVSADIAAEGGVITAIDRELPGATRELDAKGLLVLPGLIDIHVHFNEPGRTDWEGAATGSRALAAGGGVMFFDMPLNSAPCTVSAKAFDQKRAALERSSITDFALWGGLIPGSVDAMDEMAQRGVIGFKAFLSNSGLDEFPRADDLTLYRGMQNAARLGLPVALHAENEEITSGLARQAIAEGRTGMARLSAIAAGHRRSGGDHSRGCDRPGHGSQAAHRPHKLRQRRHGGIGGSRARDGYLHRNLRALSLLHRCGRLPSRSSGQVRAAAAVGLGARCAVGSPAQRQH